MAFVLVMPNKDSQQDTSDHYGSIQNLFDEDQMDTSKDTNRDADLATGDSLPSSTQTAHSWVPAMQDSGQYRKSGVGRARSFEYLPGKFHKRICRVFEI